MSLFSVGSCVSLSGLCLASGVLSVLVDILVFFSVGFVGVSVGVCACSVIDLVAGLDGAVLDGVLLDLFFLLRFAGVFRSRFSCLCSGSMCWAFRLDDDVANGVPVFVLDVLSFRLFLFGVFVFFCAPLLGDNNVLILFPVISPSGSLSFSGNVITHLFSFSPLPFTSVIIVILVAGLFGVWD